MATAIRPTIGGYLLARLRECGIDTLFGVPGDFNLVLLERLIEADRLRWVGNCNELNAAYAADGYARMKGAAALVVTYGVGDLSALNGIAGSFAEHVPVICISGMPPLQAIRQRMILHHTSGIGNIEDVMSCMSQFTVAQARITPANATAEIDRLLETALREKLPVYLQIPCDIVDLEVEAPATPLNLAPLRSDSTQLARAVEQIVRRLDLAQCPAILIDGDAHRFGLRPLICALGQTLEIPFAAMASGRTVFDEQHPLYCGIYAGAASTPKVAETIEQSDCLLAIGVRFFDVTTCVHSHRIPEANMIAIDPFAVSIDGQTFEGVTAADVLRELARHFSGRTTKASMSNLVSSFGPVAEAADPQAPLTHANLWPRIEQFLAPGDVVLAESGTVSAGIGGVRLPAGAAFIHQALWASIGYALPALLGAMLAQPGRRHVLFIGDGSLQMTAQELSTIFRHGLKPIVFVVNNGGYTIERVIYGREAVYNDIRNWDYCALPRVFSDGEAPETAKASTAGEFETALRRAQDSDCFTLIELVLDRFDAPEGLLRMGSRVAEFNFGAGEQ
jgi:indolepyruvate decarboxylase